MDSAFQLDIAGGGPGLVSAGVVFNEAGWVISDSVGSDTVIFGAVNNATVISSSGVGVNEIAATLGANNSGATSNYNIFTGAGNTLVLSGDTAFDSGDTAFTKTGSGTLVIAPDANFAAGLADGFTVANGTVLVNGTFDASLFNYAVTVGNGGTLGGTGSSSIGNQFAYDIESGGVFSPGGGGAFGDSIGSFDIARSSGGPASGDGVFTFESGSTFRVDLDDLGNSDTLTFDAAGTDAQELTLVIESGVDLDLWGTVDTSATYDLITLAGPETIYDGSAFGTVSFNGEVLTPFDDFVVTYTPIAETDIGVGGVQIQVLVPEPGAMVLVSLGGLVLVGRGRGAREG
ncbi:MAG: hypothetical protein AAFX76_02420 [Planctomycetota bacterium]